MPSEEDFEAFRMVLFGNPALRKKPLQPLLKERWASLEDRNAFLDWVSQRADKEQMILLTSPSRAELINMIDTMNYNDKLQRAELVSSVHKNIVPWIPAGTDVEGDIYRIVPQPYGLLADQQFPQTDRKIISPNVLGVNINVQPRQPSHRRIANYSEESTQSNESDDSTGTGFVFHQMGMLEIWSGETDEPKTENNVAGGPWSPADFGVVMRIDRSGAPAGVYIIYDFYPTDPSTGKRPSERRNIGHWGQLGDLPGRIAIAKIADTASELKFDRTFSPTVIADYPVELVRAVVGWGNSIMRVTFMDDRPLY